MPVVIRSRLDSSVTWTGVISKIDYENQEQNNNNGMMSDGGNNTSSKYPFYVELDGAGRRTDAWSACSSLNQIMARMNSAMVSG